MRISREQIKLQGENMKLKLIYGRAGTGKTSYCFEQVSRLINKENKIVIITPEQFSFNAEKKLMEVIDRKAIINAEVVTFNRMAYRVMAEIGGVVNTQLTECGKSMLIYSILNSKNKELKFLGKTDENIDLVNNALVEFKKHGVTTENLENQTQNTENKLLQTKLQDLSLIYQEFENQIKGKYIDETDLLSMLAENIDKVDMFNDNIFYIDEFAGFTEQEYCIIQKLLKIAKEVNITICEDNLDLNTNPETDIFYSNKITISKILDLAKKEKVEIEQIELEEVKRFKSNELDHLEKNIYNNRYKKYEKDCERIQLFLAQNQYSEIENLAKSIINLVKNEKYRYKEIGVITKNIDTYSSLIRAIFAKYDIPVFIDEKRDLNQNILVQYVLSILEIFNKNWSYESVFNYIKTGFVEIEQDEIFKLEKYCIKWGIKQNKWKKDFIYGIACEEDKKEVERIDEIRKIIVNPLMELKRKIDENKTASNISKQLYNFLIEQKLEETLKEKIEYLEEQGYIDLASEYQTSYKIIIDILDEIVLIFANDKLTIDKYYKIFKIGLKSSGLGKIPGTQDQVIIGDVDRSRSHKIRATYIIGLNDGVFPSVNKDEGFLNDNDRVYLKEQGIELAKGTLDRIYEDNFNIYKAFTTSEEKLFLSYASSDIDGKALRPSIIISKIKKLFPNLKEKSDTINEIEEISNKNVTYEKLIEKINMLQNGENIEDIWYYCYKYYSQNEEYKNKINSDITGLDYTNLPQKLDSKNIEKLYGNKLATSVSKLEKYRNCPFSYYLQYGLKLKEKEELKIQSLNTGTFMHETIDEFFDYVSKEKIELVDLTEEILKQIVEKIVEEKLTLSKNYIFTSTAKYKLLVARLKRIMVKALKYIIETLIQSRFEVLGTEVEFGQNGKYSPIVLNLDDGKKVEITGKIDRIDVCKNEKGNYLRIIDYKSSAKNIDLNEVYAGLQIQLLTYMDAVCKIEDLMPAGVLYFSLLEQMVKSDKKLSEEEIEEKIKANFRMKGLIVADINIVKMHDKNIESGSSKLIPAYIDKSGNLSYKMTSGVTESQFEDLQKYIYKTIKEIAKEIYSGKIDLLPSYNDGKTPCKYCEYKSICGFDYGFCKNTYNYIDKKSKEEILEKIKKGI